MATNGIIDAAGNNYGGTGVGSAGVGDTVTDSTGVANGTVTAILQGPSVNLHKVWVRWTIPPNSGARSHGAGNYEQVLYARQLTITAHADGTGLVSGGAAQTAIGTAPPTEYNYFM